MCKNIGYIALFLLFIFFISACAAPAAASPPKDYDELTFSWPYLAFVGKPLGEMAKELPLNTDGYNMGDRLNVTSKEPVLTDGVAYQLALNFDPTTVGFDAKAYQEDKAEADKAVLTTVTYTNAAAEQDVSAHVRKIYDAMTKSYGEPYESGKMAEDHKDLLDYTENPLVNGTYTDLWVVSDEPDYPPVEGWEPHYIIAFMTVASGSSGTDITVLYRLTEKLPDVY